MLTAAAAALLSGHANAASPCGSTSTATNCDITSEFQYPIYTGPAVPAGVTTGAFAANNNVTIDTTPSAGSIVLGINPPTAPAVTIDSSNLVNNQGTISYQGVPYATGVLLEEASVATSTSGYGLPENFTGEYYAGGSSVLNLLGAGTSKTAILIAGGAYPGAGLTNANTGIYAQTTGPNGVPTSGLGLFTGSGVQGQAGAAIYLSPGSTTEVQGTNSYGIDLIGPNYSTIGTTVTPTGGASLQGDIDIGGNLLLTPTTEGSTTQTSNVAVNIAGWQQSAAQPDNPAFAGSVPYAMVGNLHILTGGTVSSEGAGAQGVVVLGAINGAVINEGTIETYGTTTQSTALNANDPEAGPALVVANNISGGIFNGGPISGGTQARASISMIGNSETIDIAPAFNVNLQQSVTIDGYTDGAGYTYSLLNRGGITSAAEDANVSTETVFMSGQANTISVSLPKGIFNSGLISSAATTNADGSQLDTTVTATAIEVGNYVNIGQGSGGVSATALGVLPVGQTGYSLVNSNETGSGSIAASISGAQTGTATAILIDAQKTGGAAGVLSSIYNTGSISAQASTTNLNSTAIAAYAIRDESGTLQTIYNTGAISATTTTLNNNAQVADAIDVSSNSSTPVTIIDQSTGPNSADIVGDIHFGTLAGSLSVTGLSQNVPAVVTGNLYFNNASLTDDSLTVGSFGAFSGQIFQAPGAAMNITIRKSGALTLLTSQATNINSSVSVAAQPNKPLSVDTLEVDTGGNLNIALSQGNNATAFPTKNVAVINANMATIGGDGITPTLSLTFGGFVGTPSSSGQPTEFVLISSPSGLSIAPAELTLLSNTYDSALNTSTTNQKNGIPFLFTSSICTINVAGGPNCSNPPSNASTNLSSQQLILNLTPKDPAKSVMDGGLGLTGYALKMFPYANQALVNDNTLGAAMINSIKDQPTAQAAYASFAPDVSGATRATVISLTDSATNIVGARQRELRMYANTEGATTLWGQQFAQRLSQANTSTLTGYNDSGFGFVVGMDDGDRVDGRYGAAFTFFTGGMSQKEPTSAKTSSEYYLLTGYTDWRGKGLFIDTQGTVGYGTLKGRRYLTLTDTDNNTTLSREAQGNRASELAAGSITTGGIFTAGGTVFMPQIDVDGMTMREEGYTESGGGDGFDLRVQPYYADSLRAFLGTDVRQDFNFGDFFLQPELRAGYRYDFANGITKLKANFASVNSLNGQAYTPFSIEGPDPGHGNLVLGTGIATTTGAWSIGFNFDYVKASNGPSEQTGVLTLIGRI
ncbi:MAG TPA: autotransporter outer membrane beta-barrel domain-containing protein [Rhizomicrobium sp.]|nr:autotransporter outer membrane beta-barrel domain-containing protein [Rhizomicrobium sp.]